MCVLSCVSIQHTCCPSCMWSCTTVWAAPSTVRWWGIAPLRPGRTALLLHASGPAYVFDFVAVLSDTCMFVRCNDHPLKSLDDPLPHFQIDTLCVDVCLRSCSYVQESYLRCAHTDLVLITGFWHPMDEGSGGRHSSDSSLLICQQTFWAEAFSVYWRWKKDSGWNVRGWRKIWWAMSFASFIPLFPTEHVALCGATHQNNFLGPKVLNVRCEHVSWFEIWCRTWHDHGSRLCVWTQNDIGWEMRENPFEVFSF